MSVIGPNNNFNYENVLKQFLDVCTKVLRGMRLKDTDSVLVETETINTLEESLDRVKEYNCLNNNITLHFNEDEYKLVVSKEGKCWVPNFVFYINGLEYQGSLSCEDLQWLSSYYANVLDFIDKYNQKKMEESNEQFKTAIENLFKV